MSDQSQGPGWWQASDGKWYPPEQAPPTAQQPPVGPTTQQPAYGPPGSVPPAAGAPMAGPPVAAAAGGGGAGKIIAIVVVLALVAGGGAFLLTRGGGSSGSVKAFCDTAKKFQNDANLNSAFDDPKKVDQVASAFDQLTKSAPSEIKGDMQTLNDAIKKIAAAVKSAGSDPSKAFPAILAATATLDEAKLQKASDNVDKFGKEKCGIDFSSSSKDSDSSFTFDSSSFESSLSSSFSSFDSDSFSSGLESLCSEFGSDFGSDFCSSS